MQGGMNWIPLTQPALTCIVSVSIAHAHIIKQNEGAPSSQAAPEEVFKSSSITTTSAAPAAASVTPKQAEVVTSTGQSTAGSTPAHVGSSNITNKVSTSFQCPKFTQGS